MRKDEFGTLDTVLLIVAMALLFVAVVVGIMYFQNDIGTPADEADMGRTNMLAALAGENSADVYDKLPEPSDSYLYLDKDEKKPYFKVCNDYTALIEAYNAPANTDVGVEIFGFFGLRFKLEASEECLAYSSALESLEMGDTLIPYYVVEQDGVVYISCAELLGSAVSLERSNGSSYEEISSVSGGTWREVLDKNGGTAVLRNPDGSMIYGVGEYRFTVSLKQILVTVDGDKVDFRIMQPSFDYYTLQVNNHPCANGVLISTDGTGRDIQLNIVNSESNVCYPSGSSINVDSGLSIGISLSEDMQKRLSNVFSSLGARGTVSLYGYDYEKGEYVLLQTERFAKGRENFANTLLKFDSEGLKNGKYKLVMSYKSWVEEIAEEYDCYLVFGG